MSTRLENIQRIRSLLDYPQPSRPSFAQVFQMELSVEMDVLNATNNTDRPWAVNTTELNYSPNNGLPWALTVNDFAKPILVQRLTPQNPFIKAIPVPFEDLNHPLTGTIWNLWNGFYGWAWGMNETVERMTFYREGVTDSQYMVAINPSPQEACTYTIQYVPNTVDREGSLESTIQLPEMAELVQVRTALQLLPYAAWYEDEGANDSKRKTLMAGLEFQLQRKEPIFQRFISNLTKPKDVWLDNWAGANT